jgi:hypothetical protein
MQPLVERASVDGLEHHRGIAHENPDSRLVCKHQPPHGRPEMRDAFETYETLVGSDSTRKT